MNMTVLRSAALVLTGVALSTQAAEQPFMTGKRFVAGDYSGKKIALVEADGSISWQHAAPDCNDLWIMPGGSILFTTGHGVKEVEYRTGKVLFEYNSKSEIYAVQRLAEGTTFVGECNSGRLLTVDAAGGIIKTVNLLPEGKDGGHAYYRNARVLKSGNYLVAHYGAKEVIEYSPEGKVLWQVKTPGGPHSTCRLANGHTMVSCGDNGTPALVEYNPQGEVVWQLSNADLEGAPLKFLTGFQMLPNGHVLISNWLGHGKFGTAPHLLEITREKKVVWTYADHTAFRAVASVQVMHADGTPVPAEGLH